MLNNSWVKFTRFTYDWSAALACICMGLAINCAVVWFIHGQPLSIVLGITYAMSAGLYTKKFIKKESRTEQEIAMDHILRRYELLIN